jgi:serine/threonine protein kinase
MTPMSVVHRRAVPSQVSSYASGQPMPVHSPNMPSAKITTTVTTPRGTPQVTLQQGHSPRNPSPCVQQNVTSTVTASAVVPAPVPSAVSQIQQQHAQPAQHVQASVQQQQQSQRGPQGGNKSLGHYILGKTIGEGTFGKVKLGRHILTGERVAVKVLEKDRIIEVADIERVAREVQLLKLLRHPHVVQLFEIIETKGQLYLIMEYASGGELFDYIVNAGRVPEPEACRFFHQIMAGVEKIHAMNVVHRDLKPENLLLDEHKCIKIVDFGLSNRFRDGQRLKTACGSPCYAPPEMVAGMSYVPALCDLWSCGVILFAMVCGFLPFEDSNTKALYEKILSAKYTPPSFISASVKELIAGLLTVDPAQRFTIARVRAHPWYQQIPEASVRPRDLLPGQLGLDEDVLAELKRHGFPRDYAISCIQMNKHNNVTTTYYLLAAKRRRMQEQLQHRHFDEDLHLQREPTCPASPTPPQGMESPALAVRSTAEPQTTFSTTSPSMSSSKPATSTPTPSPAPPSPILQAATLPAPLPTPPSTPMVEHSTIIATSPPPGASATDPRSEPAPVRIQTPPAVGTPRREVSVGEQEQPLQAPPTPPTATASFTKDGQVDVLLGSRNAAVRGGHTGAVPSPSPAPVPAVSNMNAGAVGGVSINTASSLAQQATQGLNTPRTRTTNVAGMPGTPKGPAPQAVAPISSHPGSPLWRPAIQQLGGQSTSLPQPVSQQGSVAGTPQHSMTNVERRPSGSMGMVVGIGSSAEVRENSRSAEIRQMQVPSGGHLDIFRTAQSQASTPNATPTPSQQQQYRLQHQLQLQHQIQQQAQQLQQQAQLHQVPQSPRPEARYIVRQPLAMGQVQRAAMGSTPLSARARGQAGQQPIAQPATPRGSLSAREYGTRGCATATVNRTPAAAPASVVARATPTTPQPSTPQARMAYPSAWAFGGTRQR